MFKDEENKSKLINSLLARHYGLIDASDKVIPETPVLIATPRHAKEAVKQIKQGKAVRNIGFNVCPLGHVLQEGRSKCSTKGCKYS